MLRIAIVEDDERDAHMLAEYCGRAARELGENADIKIYSEPIVFLEKYKADWDIVFMDIELPGMDGLETARRLRGKDGGVVLIFVTNMAQFALEGYTVDAMDFIVKPVVYETLRVRLARAVKRVALRRGERIIVAGRNQTRVVSVPDIRYVEVMNHKLTFYTTDGEVEGIGTLASLEEKLKKYDFSRCNACYLVNLDFVDKIEDGYAVVGGSRLSISRSRRTGFIRDLADHLGGGGGV